MARLLLALAFAALASGLRADCWDVSVVDAPGRDVLGADLAFRADGLLVVSYTTQLGIAPSKVEFASWMGSGWAREHVADTAEALTSVALNPVTGEPAIAYCYSGTLYYASRASGTWNVESTGATGSGICGASLAFDPAGHPFISTWAGGLVRVTSHDGVAWSHDLVDTVTGWSGANTGIAFDDTGTESVAYYDGNAGDLRYARKETSGWQLEIVDAVGTKGWYPSIAVAPGGEAFVAAEDGVSHELRVAQRTGVDAWSPVTVDSLDSYSTVAIDPAGNPAVAHGIDGRATIVLSRWDRTAWTNETVDAGGPFYHSVSMAFDSVTGRPAIAYTTAREVRVARWAPGLVVHRRAVTSLVTGWQAGALPLTAANDDAIPPFPWSDCGAGVVTDTLAAGVPLVLYRPLSDAGAEVDVTLRVRKSAGGIDVAY